MHSDPRRASGTLASTLRIGGAGALVAGALAVAALAAPRDAAAARQVRVSPIQHVVILFQENHSFDNVLGKFCVETQRCNGAVKGYLHDGERIPLRRARDIVWHIKHTPTMMRTAIAGGAMDGFDLLENCGADVNYACYSQYDPKDIPNLTALASAFVISDATFQSSLSGSWTSHIELVSSTLDGFTGYNPVHSRTGHKRGPGWGCNSFLDARWSAPAPGPTDGRRRDIFVPACIPDQQGIGPYRTSPVPWVPTIMDELDAAGRSWKLYGGNGLKHTSYHAGYFWEVCPTFFECMSTGQAENAVPISQIVPDAKGGDLPAVSLVTPTLRVSQHNGVSMREGDDWMGQVVSAIEQGPDWGSTAIFITYDECGCFYDHVTPPDAGRGLRVPMVIVSPYAKPAFTDSHPASFNSMLAFIEDTFGLPPMSSQDRRAYDFSHAFDYSQTPLSPVRMVREHIPSWEARYLTAHPAEPDDT
jgi:phospholipase C